MMNLKTQKSSKKKILTETSATSDYLETVQDLLGVLEPEFVCKGAKLRILDDNCHIVKIRKIRCEYVYGEDVKKTVILEI